MESVVWCGGWAILSALVAIVPIKQLSMVPYCANTQIKAS